ncbi:hypothetical protein SRABI118_00291 [Massilia sp. Bi118]|uniref:hypothetical protein n=1 Tax=Massilia sp. Bi118 TaxID=2822346 RepID=UPI001E154C9D|nr:hypothetical protein [Massilia sp. Bi118]CAH0141318.1 hypothetical protein SRABI118_00291 [Massilia sp. Bi118]
MTTPHLLNVLVHILAGSAAIVLGLYLLGKPKDAIHHRRRGRVFVLLTAVVCLSAAVGNAVFRFLPLFAVLTVLVSYQLLSGWHVIYTRANGPDKVDAGLLLGAVAMTAMLVRRLFADGAMVGAAASVLYSTLAAVMILLAYDAVRWLFPRCWHAALWRYEHIYKMLGCLFGMLSAAVGNTVRVGQPWSQLAPSVLGMIVVLCCWVRIYRAQRRALEMRPRMV